MLNFVANTRELILWTTVETLIKVTRKENYGLKQLELIFMIFIIPIQVEDCQKLLLWMQLNFAVKFDHFSHSAKCDAATGCSWQGSIVLTCF